MRKVCEDGCGCDKLCEGERERGREREEEGERERGRERKKLSDTDLKRGNEASDFA